MPTPRRVELVTFAVALAAALATFVVLELRKPGNGILPAGRAVEQVVHKDSGAVLLEGNSRLGALLRHAAMRRRPDALTRTGVTGAEDLTGADLDKMNFSNSDITGLAVRGGRLNDTDFRETLLIEADFEGAEFRRADFSRAVMDRAKFTNAILRAARFTAATAQDADFREADLTDADLSGANFRRADFTGADFLGVLFSESTDLEDALLVDARNMSEEFREFAGRAGAVFEASGEGEAPR